MKAPPTFYVYLQFKIAEHSGANKVIDQSKVFELLGKYRIPKNLKYKILKELESYKLIEKRKYLKIQVVNCKIDSKGKDLDRVTRRNYYVNQIINPSLPQ